MTKRITIMGSTGSIGTSTLDIVAAAPDSFTIHALVAGSNATLLAEQALRFRPKFVGINDERQLASLQSALVGTGIEVVAGTDACTSLAAESVDIVVAGIVGLAGLPSVMAAVRAGQTVALANKESLVSAGGVVTRAAQSFGARLLPLDSEHSAIFQCWQGWAGHSETGQISADTSDISHICLTASGGPFRDRPLNSFESITPADAIKHPNWEMGRKISVDSATMMNKGLEVIEAAWLFDLAPDRIEVLIHPEVAIHGLVYFRDGSVISQIGTADMKTPISYALAWPQRLPWDPSPLDLAGLGQLNFRNVDLARYPCFGLAVEALTAGGNAAAVLNGANEIAVSAFLDGKIGFMRIAEIVDAVLQSGLEGDVDSLEAVFATDKLARDAAHHLVAAT